MHDPEGTSLRTSYRSITELACDKLRDDIISGAYQPGEQLKERDLAARIGVSTTPIKAALQRLTLEGLVTSIPMCGTFVAESVGSQLSEFGLIRAALEGAAAYLAATKVTEAEVDRLRSQLRLMEKCTAERDAARVTAANKAFHAIIHEIACNNTLQQMAEMVRRYDDLTRTAALADEDEMLQGWVDHSAIFDAIVARDPLLAESRMRGHVLRTSLFLQRRRAGEHAAS